jgi:hypothetical protein
VRKKEGRAAAMNQSSGARYSAGRDRSFRPCPLPLGIRADVARLEFGRRLFMWAVVALGGYVIFALRTERS